MKVLSLVKDGDLIGARTLGIQNCYRVVGDQVTYQNGIEHKLTWAELTKTNWVVYRQIPPPLGDGPYAYYKGKYYYEVT